MDPSTPAPEPVVDLHDAHWAALAPDALAVIGDHDQVLTSIPGFTSIIDDIHPDDLPRIVEALSEARSMGSASSVPVRRRDVNGEWARGLLSATDLHTNRLVGGLLLRWRPMRATDGAAPIDDATFRTIVDAASEGVWLVDFDHRTLYANPSMCRMLGYTEDELAGTAVADHVPLQHHAELAERRERRRRGVTESFDLDYVRKDGTTFAARVSSAPILGADGELLGTVALVMDRNDERRARDAELMQRAAIDLAPVGMFELDAAGEQVLYANAACRELVRLPPDATFRTLIDQIHPDDAVIFERPVERVDTWLDQRVRVQRYDEDRWVEVRIAAVPDGDGRTLRHVGTLTDVSASVEFELQLGAAVDAAVEASRMKSEFLANMSHEIRTPLNGVIGMATLLLDTPLNREQRERVVTMRSAGEHLLALVNDILDFSKVETGHIELEHVDFDVLGLVSEVASLYSSPAFDKGVRLRIDLDTSVPRAVVGDPARLRQVLSNLVGNAVKFTEIGAVTIRVTSEGRHSTTIRFEVVDTGIGIDPDAQARIWDPFVQADASTTRRFGGTGLGLPICRRLVELMGGVLSLDSVVGKGSNFWFTVPFSAPDDSTPPPTTAPARATAGTSGGPRGRLLLVEDNPINQKVALGFLGHLGYEADVANDGLEAFEIVREGRAYVMILMDCQMPRMDGYEATARIRQWEASTGRAHLPVIALTAGAMPGDRERCLEAGMDDYISKPIDLGRLSGLLDKWASTSATPAPGTASLLDGATVQQLRELPGAGGTLFDELAVMFCERAPELFGAIRASAEAQRWDEMAAHAHALKGVSANLGATQLAGLAGSTQIAGEHDGDTPDGIESLLDRLELAARAVVDELAAVTAGA